MSTKGLAGTRLNTQNSKLLTSTGIDSVDSMLNGGIPVGTITIIEEDTYGTYAKILLQHIFAEGVIHNHLSFVASLDENPHNMMQVLPSVVYTKSEEQNSIGNIEDNMKIAFRYQNLPTQKQNENILGHYFDLTKTVASSELEKCNIHYWTSSEEHNNTTVFSNPTYGKLLTSIKNKIHHEKLFLNDNNNHKSILRIGIHSLGSPMWFCSTDGLNLQKETSDLAKFFYHLRALVRSAFAVVVVTVPSHLYPENAFARCIHSSDIVLRLQAFAGTELEKCTSLTNYHGFFHLTKLAPINTFATKHPGSAEHVFKLKQKVLVVEKLHLPPDVASVSDLPKSGVSCGSSNKTLLDF